MKKNLCTPCLFITATCREHPAWVEPECFTYDDLVEHGSEESLRRAGRFRLEGKTYAVRDGDILNIRFSV